MRGTKEEEGKEDVMNLCNERPALSPIVNEIDHYSPFSPSSFCSSSANRFGFFIGLSGLGLPPFSSLALAIEAIDVDEDDRECDPGEDERSMFLMRRRETTGLQGADCVGVVVLPS